VREMGGEQPRRRHKGGVASAVDVAQAQTQLETTRAQATDVQVQRAQFEHAIAVLIGEPPSTLSLTMRPWTSPPPQIPAGLPSDLLERRPDIAAAERRMAAANAQIGVAVAGYFPDLTLNGTFGYASNVVSGLVRAPNNLWSFGGSATPPLFDFRARPAPVRPGR